MFVLSLALLAVGVLLVGGGGGGGGVRGGGQRGGRGAADERVRALAQAQQLVLDALRDGRARLLLARVRAA